MRQPRDQCLAPESAEIVCGLVAGVWLIPEATDQLDELAVVEAVERMREQHQRGQQSHDPWIAECEGRGMEAVCRRRRPGHVCERDHIRGRSCGLRFGVTQTPVG